MARGRSVRSGRRWSEVALGSGPRLIAEFIAKSTELSVACSEALRRESP
jgi:hypothetical protein